MDHEELNRRFEELGSRVSSSEASSHTIVTLAPVIEQVAGESNGPDEEVTLFDPPEEHLPGGTVTLHGTDESELAGDDFTFVSAADSNVAVKLEETTGSDAKMKIEIGVYYV